MISVLTNGNPQARFWTPTAIALMGTNARPAVPALILCLNDSAAAGPAFHALGALKMEPDLVVPAVTNMANDLDPTIRLNVLATLADFGQKARSAIPTVLNALYDPNANVRAGATNAILAIAPESLTNAPAR